MFNINPLSHKTDSNISIITLHGYLESCYTMSYINQILQELNYNVESPNLLGHGGLYSDLHNIKYQDWIKQIETIYKKQNKENKKIIIGYSFGGMLALSIAMNFKVSGIVLINHLFNHLPLSVKSARIGKHFVKYVPNVKPDIKNHEPIFLYNWISCRNTSEIIKLSKLLKMNIRSIKCPVLIFKSKNDHRVNRNNAIDTYNQISSIKKEIIYLNNSYHVAPLDYDKKFLMNQIIKFINEVI